MFKLPFVLAFTAMTAFFWGIYGIVLHKGSVLMGHNSLRAFVGVGLAYFLIAVLVPVALLNRKRETGFWSMSGTIMSLFAGAVGALGALGVTLALGFGGQAIYVMPIVFGGAPVVNTLLTSWLNKSFKQITPMFVVGMVMVALGMVGVLYTKPQPKVEDAEAIVNWLAVGLSIAMAVVCWGAYGPFLHIGQSKMGGSRLRPFCCVGIAYFVIAVAIPVVILESMPSDGGYTFWGMIWSVLAGAAGAMGALGIIMAFTYGGKPIFVMPLVFGFAPVINTITSIIVSQKFDSINALFAGALALGIAGAVTVLLNAPKSKPHGPGPTPGSSATGTQATGTPAPKSTSPAAPGATKQPSEFEQTLRSSDDQTHSS
jgi:hypothetical protein